MLRTSDEVDYVIRTLQKSLLNKKAENLVSLDKLKENAIK
jgi:hypothetical protein